MASVQIAALPQMARIAARHKPPFIARISASGKVQLIYKPRR